MFPIFKGGNKYDPSNYRHISILSSISKKKLQRHVNKHLMNYPTKYKLILEHQPGYRKNIAARLHWSTLLINGCLVLGEKSLHTNLVTRLYNGLNPFLTDEDRESKTAKVCLSFKN